MNLNDILIGKSEATKRLQKQLVELSASRKNVLLIGEAGTGKTMIATAIADCDSASKTVNLALVQENEVDGLFSEIPTGTIVIEGLDSTSFAVQSVIAKILNAHSCNRRFIVTLRETVADLSAKRRIVDEIETSLLEFESVEILPIRQRQEDIPQLVRHFAGDAVIDMNALESLTRRGWRDNVRELKNVVQMSLAESHDGMFFLPQEYVEERTEIAHVVNSMISTANQGLDASLDEMEKNIIRRALHRFGFNTEKAAQFLGMSDNTLADKLHRLALVKSKGR